MEGLKEIKGYVEIELYDGKHYLLYSKNALKQLTKDLDCSLEDLEKVLDDDRKIFDNIDILLKAGLQHEKIQKREPKYTDDDIEYLTETIAFNYQVEKVMLGLEGLGDMMGISSQDISK